MRQWFGDASPRPVVPVRPALARLAVTGMVVVLLVVPVSYGQVDTTETPTPPPDTMSAPAADTTALDSTAAPHPDTTRADTTERPTANRESSRSGPGAGRDELPDTPRSFPDPVYGRSPVDSLPALTPHAGLEHVLARQSGSFLYDLGSVGWPHGWSPRGLGPHRSGLWLDGHPYDSPLTGRARFDLLPTAFLQRPGLGPDPGGSAVGVHTAWRDYDQVRPITELRFRRDGNGLQSIEVGHSQQHRLSLFGGAGLFQLTFGYGGRATDGIYDGSDLRRERRFWGRLRYQRDDWAIELSDLSSRHRIGAHSGVVPPEGAPFGTVYVLPTCENCSVNPGARRNTFRNDLTARVRGPLLPGTAAPTELSATWTSNTFDFETGGGAGNSGGASGVDTTWTTKLHGGHSSLRQSLQVGPHTLTLGARGSLWGVARSNVSGVDGTQWRAHAFARDSLRLGRTDLVLDGGWHVTADQQYPSAAVRAERPLGPVRLTAAATMAGQRPSWYETTGFEGLVRPLSDAPPSSFGRVMEGRTGVNFSRGTVDVGIEGFAHRIRDALDLYAVDPPAGQRVASTDTADARRTATPVRRVGATVTLGWRRDVDRGLYLSGRATTLTTLSDGESPLQARLADTLPQVYGRGRIGARFVVFVDLVTDLYVEARGWTAMSSRWFHPPTGRLVVPPSGTSIPARSGTAVGPNGTVDIHADIELRGATLFFALENAQVSFAAPGSTEKQATLQPGTFTVPVYPLPARQFRFGVHWPIFD